MAINCGHCGAAHDSVAEVRECATGDAGAPHDDALPLPIDPWPDDDADPVVRPASRTGDAAASIARDAHTAPDPDADPVARPDDGERVRAGAGPDRLGRNVVVTAGEEPPPPWADCPRLRIDRAALDAPETTVAELRTAAGAGERRVIELAADFDAPPDEVTDLPPEALGPRFAFVLDELHHLVWSNAVDARGDEPTWPWLDLAIRLGARPIDAAAHGDVELPDHGPVWLDGGPLRHLDPIDGVPVVHVVAVEHATRHGGIGVPGPNRSTADLAPDQLAAVTHPGGAARIIAPAGSGKTRVLTERARHLLGQWRLPAGAVGLVAFNKRAQEEMRERTSDLPALQVRTLNSIALAIVNGVAPFAPQSRRWRTIDEGDVRRVVGDLVSFPRRRNADPVAPWIEALSQVRLGLVSPDDVEGADDGDIVGFAEFWPQYRRVLDTKGLVDFDDQIYRAISVLLTDPAARRAAQRACRTMLVDEFQDLTPAHLLLVRLLAAPGGAVFGVGDDDQTIYGYNGADPGWLIDFADLFPGAGAHPLEVNYRCPGGVVDVVDRLLRHNRRRVAKTIRAASDDEGGWSVEASVDPVGATGDAVAAAIAAGARPAEIAVLTRVNSLLAPVQVALASRGVPISGGVGLDFVERTSVRAVLAWLRLAAPSRRGFRPDDVAEALRRPSRSFHPRVGDWIGEQTDVVGLFALAGRLRNERDADRLTEFAADVQTLQKQVAGGAVTSDLVFTLVDEIGLGGAVSGLDSTRRGMNRTSQGDDLTAIQHLAALHDDPTTFERWLRDGLAVSRSADGVVLSTVHRVKGQEWPHVVVHHADAEQYPHRLADDVEEERRLFHVALTRASRHVTVVPGPSPSPFVDELETEPSEDRVVRSHRPEPVRSAGGSAKSSAGDPAAELDDAERELFERLRTMRTRLADGKPAYTVFDNKTLAAIARARPASRRDLHRISGVGPAKLDKYGDDVLAVVADA